jgi:hypothetical protein
MSFAVREPAHTVIFERRCAPATQPGAPPGQGVWRLVVGAILDRVETADRFGGSLRSLGKKSKPARRAAISKKV